MTPTSRTPQQRDRRFARIRRISQVILLGSGVVSGLLVTFIASSAKPYTTVPVTVPPGASSAAGAGTSTSSTSSTSTAPSTSIAGGAGATSGAPVAPTTPTTVYTPPTTAPVTTTTTCYSTPSGTVTCY